MGVRELAMAIRVAVQQRIDEESRAKRGVIQGGRFISGSKSYPMLQAVDVDTSNGKRVWAQLSKNGSAVVVGA